MIADGETIANAFIARAGIRRPHFLVKLDAPEVSVSLGHNGELRRVVERRLLDFVSRGKAGAGGGR